MKRIHAFSPPTIVLVCATVFSASGLAANSDWGYSDGKPAVPQAPSAELKAGPAGALQDGKPTAKKPAVHPPGPPNQLSQPAVRHAATAKPGSPSGSRTPRTNSSNSSAAAISDWLALYRLVSKQPLNDDQSSKIESLLNAKLRSDQSDVLSILSYSPQADAAANKDPDLKGDLANLLRALLRFESRSKQLDPKEVEILAEVLGPERVAVPGDPPLTEEAIDAYADMACFMYEQRHPGKTIDATDNRAIFASVICNKYNEAPTDKDRKGVANFALSWSKFKIAWMRASADQREHMLSHLEAGSKSANEGSDELLDLIIRSGPWSHVKI